MKDWGDLTGPELARAVEYTNTFSVSPHYLLDRLSSEIAAGQLSPEQAEAATQKLIALANLPQPISSLPLRDP